jgi:DNA-binding response OmpR family regulator
MSDQIRTLIVEDEEMIRLVLAETLRRAGHVVTTASSGEEALDLLQESGFDVILLDLMLGSRVDGQRVLEAVRWRWPGTVVIILTGHGTLESAMQAIREGVEGYLLKPVAPEEVRQAVDEALYRRKKLQEAQGAEAEAVLERGPFVIDLRRHTASLDGQLLDLSSREFLLLAHLMQSAPQVVSSKELVEAVREYRPEFEYEARDIIKWYIFRLRQKVEPDPAKPRHILNVRGVGYRFAE